MKEVQAANDLDREFPADPSGRTVRNFVQETVDGPVRTMTITRGQRTITERTMYDRSGTAGGFRYDAARMTMSELTSILVLHTGRPVIDSTKLTGVYNFSIELPVPPFVVQGLAAAGITAAVDGTPINMPSAASAVKGVEQLGAQVGTTTPSCRYDRRRQDRAGSERQLKSLRCDAASGSYARADLRGLRFCGHWLGHARRERRRSQRLDGGLEKARVARSSVRASPFVLKTRKANCGQSGVGRSM